MDLKHIPRSAPKNMLPGLKLKDLVQLRNNDFSQDKRAAIKTLERGTVGRVMHILRHGATKATFRPPPFSYLCPYSWPSYYQFLVRRTNESEGIINGSMRVSIAK